MRKAKRIINVKPHTRSGTKVKRHKRSYPDGIKENNHSYRGK